MAVGLLLSLENRIGQPNTGTWVWQIVSVDADLQPLFLQCTDTCTQVDVAASGDTLSLIASPDPGSAFGGWSGVDLDKGTFAQVTFTDSDRTVTATLD